MKIKPKELIEIRLEVMRKMALWQKVRGYENDSIVHFVEEMEDKISDANSCLFICTDMKPEEFKANHALLHDTAKLAKTLYTK